MTPPARRPPHGEEGFALIEILVSALILAIVAAGVMALLQATTRAANDQRRHSEAQALAQEDQARLRTMRLSSLNKLVQTRTVTLDGINFTVESSSVFVNNSTGNDSSCATGNLSADYVRLTSKVTWGGMGSRPPVTFQSIVAPSSGSLDPSHGILAITAINAAGKALSGVGLAGSGPGTFSGTTDANGCAHFADLASGNYTLTPTAPGMVDKTGSAPKAQTVGVIPSSTAQVQLQYDLPGSVPVNFKYRVGSTSELKASSADSILAFNAETGGQPKAFASTSGNREATVSATSLFPFTTPYSLYAGWCSSNNPNPKSEKEPPGAAAMASVVVPAGKAAPAATIQLPALNVTVKNGSTLLNGATVRLTETNCNAQRFFTTNSSGALADPGMPWGTYEVCASATISGGSRRKKQSGVSVQNLTSGTSLTFDLSSGYESKSC